MSWITRFNQFYGLISSGKIPAANKNSLKTYSDEADRRHWMLNYYDDRQAAGLDLIADYNAVYSDFHTIMTAALADMTTDYTISDVSVFVNLLERYTFSEGFCLFLASKGNLAVTKIKVLSALTDSGTAGELAVFEGGLYVYSSSWIQKSCSKYKGTATTVPTAESNAMFLAGANTTHTDVLYVNGTALEVNGSALEVTRAINKGAIYYYDGEWLQDYGTGSYRYAAAVEEFVDLVEDYPEAVNNTLAKAVKHTASNLISVQSHITSVESHSSDISTTQTSISSKVAAGDSDVDDIVADFAIIKAGLQDIIDEIEEYIPGYSQQQAG